MKVKKKIKSYEKVTRMNGVVLYDDSTVRTKYPAPRGDRCFFLIQKVVVLLQYIDRCIHPVHKHIYY